MLGRFKCWRGTSPDLVSGARGNLSLRPYVAGPDEVYILHFSCPGWDLEVGSVGDVAVIQAPLYVNSIGISFVIEVLEALKGAGGRLSFCDATPKIEKTLQIMGLLQESTMHDGEDEGVVDLGG